MPQRKSLLHVLLQRDGRPDAGGRLTPRIIRWSRAFRPLGATLCVSLLLAGCGPLSLSEEERFERALVLHEQGALREAEIEFKNLLQQNPGHAPARLQLGLISLELRDLGTARNELRRAADLGADPGVVQLALGRLWLMEGSYDRVLAELEPLIVDAPDASARAHAQVLRGEALVGLGRLPEARESFEEALSEIPGLSEALLGLARADISEGRWDTAREPVQMVLDTDGTAHAAWRILGDIERAEGRIAEAETAYGMAIAHNPVPYPDYMARALLRVANSDTLDLSSAEQDLQAMRRLAPRSAGTAYVEGALRYSQQRYPDAQAALEQALSDAPDSGEVLFLLGATQLAQGFWTQAELSLTRYLRIRPDSNDAARLLAQVRLRSSDYQGAEDLLRPVLEQTPDDPVSLRLMGAVQMTRGDHEQGVEYLRRLSATRPDDAAARTSLAQGLLEAGASEEAIRELEAGIAGAPGDFQLQVRLVTTLLGSRDFDAALAAAERMAAAWPDDPLPQNLQGIALLGKGDRAAAEAAFESALGIAPGHPEASVNLAQLAVERGEVAEARRLLQAALQANPGHLELGLRLARLEASAGELEAMRVVLERLAEARPAALEPRLMLAQFHLQRNEPRRALSILEPVRESGAGDPEMLELLARAQIGAGLGAQAVTTLRRFSEVVATDVAATRRAGLLFEMAGSARDARAQYRRGLDLEPNHVPSLQSLATLEWREGRSDEALSLARRMQGLPDAAAAGYWIEGRVQSEADRHERAVAALQRAYELEPSANVAVQLALVQQTLGRLDDAETMLRARLQANPDEDNVRLVFAQVLLGLDDPAGAIREYEELHRTQPQNPTVLNNLAYLYHGQGDSRALGHAEEARNLRPDDPAIAHTLGRILLDEGNAQRALPLLQQAREGLPANAEVRYSYALGLNAAGQRADARRELSGLLDEFDTFPERGEAEELLRQLQ